MFNPFLAIVRHYNPLRSPIVVHRCREGLTIELRLPFRSAAYAYSLHECKWPAESEIRPPEPRLNVQIGAHAFSLFWSDVVLSLSHGGPESNFRDRLQVHQSVWSHEVADAREPTFLEWTNDYRAGVGPLSITANTADRQERALAEYRANLKRQQNAVA